jgi:hypothetical protein
MCRAVRVVRSGEMGYLKASKYVCTFLCRELTLEMHVKDTAPSPEELVKLAIRKKNCCVPSELDNKLVEYCIIVDQRCYGQRRQDIKYVAFQMAIGNALKRLFNQEKSTAGRKWLRSFSKSHPILSIRILEGISAARVKDFTSENKARFFWHL